jgi:hypothetical protein
MRITMSPLFKSFLDNNNRYPWNEIRKTRTSFVCKWVLLRSTARQANEVTNCQTEFNSVLSSSFPQDMLEQHLMSGRMFPLTPDFNGIMDDMHVWGQRKSYEWYCDVLELLHSALTGDADVGRKQIVSEVIELQLTATIYMYFAYNSPVAKIVLEEWNQFFHKRYTRSLSVAELTIQSEQLVIYRIAQLLSNA